MGSLNSCIIAYKSLGVGSYDYGFSIDNDFFAGFEGSEITAGNCNTRVVLKRSESMLEAAVSISGEVVVACDRCLEDCSIEIDYSGTLLVKFSSEIDQYDGEILWLSPAESELNLGQYIYESIVLSLPYQRIHAEGECNEEMISKFAIISGQELEAIAEGAEGAEEEEEEEENQGLGAKNLATLQALKEKMLKDE